MRVRKGIFRMTTLSLAMVGAFSSMYSYADEEEVAVLKYPTSTVEVEEIYVSQGSQKFGEYNGLNKQGGYINGNINIRGGDSYKGNETGATDRWSVTGTNLGLSNRSANIGYSDQGNLSVGVGYDQLQHNLAPGYQTPYQGQMGGNGWTLPAGFGTISNTTLNTIGNLTPAKQAAFGPMDISSTRENTSLSASKIIDQSLNFTLDYNHLNQTGAKLMGFGAASMGTSATGQTIAVLPNPTNYQTDTVNAAANWMGEKARLSASYFGSFFRDAYSGVNWTTFAGANVSEVMSTPPSNQLQQLNLSGGYDFSAKTKLAGSLSYGRNTQNSSSGYDSQMMVNSAYVPAFNGLVNTAHADIKLIDQSVKDLNLSAGAKYDSRDNLSQSNIQKFYSINNDSPTAYPNTPLSYRKAQIDLAGEYKLDKQQKVGLAYSNQNINRFCNQYAVTGPAAPGQLGYPAGADCVTANFTRSNILDAFYKLNASDTVSVKVGYTYDIRQTTYNQNAIAAFSTTHNIIASGFGSGLVTPGQNGGDYIGNQPYFEASRNQQVTKARVNWNATEDLTTGLTGKYIYSTYPASTYGVQNGTAWNLALDGTLQYAEEGSASLYVVQQNGDRNLTNLYYSTAANYTTWNNNLTEHDTTFGLGVKHGGLMSGKLALNGDLTYSLGQTFYNTTIGAGPNTTYTVASGAYGSPPAIRNNLIALKLGGAYQIDKKSKVGLQYLYQRLVASDYYYNGYQSGITPTTVLPTNQNPGGYNVSVITLGYTYSFD